MRSYGLVMCMAVVGALAAASGAAKARAAVPGLIFTTAITQDVNATSAMTQLPLSVLGLSPFTTTVGSPPYGLKFTTAGTYKVTGQFLVYCDLATLWSFGMQLDTASPGTYTLPTVTTPMTFVNAPLLPNTYIATMTVDVLSVSVNDVISIASSVQPKVPGTPYVITPKILKGLGGTVITVQTVP